MATSVPQTMLVNGVEESVVEIEIISSEERWNEYLLEDGSVLRLKMPLLRVWRICGPPDSQGDPRYVTRTGCLSVVRRPQEGTQS